MTNERPGCVSIFAVIQGLFAGVFLLGGIALMAESDLGTGLFGLLLAAFQGALTIGLWRMKSWAWWATVIMVGLGALGSLVNLAGGQPEALVTLIVQGIVLYRFGTHKHLFEADRVPAIAAMGSASSPRESVSSVAPDTRPAAPEPRPLSLEPYPAPDAGRQAL